MNLPILHLLFALFLIAHGLIHMSLAAAPLPKPGEPHTPFWPAWWRDMVDHTWPASRLGLPLGLVRTAGWILWLIVLVAYALAGLGLMGVPGLHPLWQPLAAGASLASLLLLGFYWHPWLVMGVVIDLCLLAGVYTGWLTRLFSIN